MPLTDLDRLYFGIHPGRHYRLRRQTPAESAAWLVRHDPNFVPWCIVRRADGVVKPFTLKIGETLDDNDLELSALFDRLRALE